MVAIKDEGKQGKCGCRFKEDVRWGVVATETRTD